jgi:outer membrane lipoprotein
MGNVGKYVTVGLLSAILCGCASSPITRDLRDQAQQLTITQVRANPQTTRGTMVVWGGRIINVVNTTNGGEIYVLQLPLSGRGRPATDNTLSDGRFIAMSPGFLDPVTYPRGHLVTIAGVLNGTRNERLQNVFYLYPLLNIRQIYLWPVRQRVNNSLYYFGGFPDWYWTYYDPLWWDGGVGWYYPGEANPDERTRSGGGHR